MKLPAGLGDLDFGQWAYGLVAAFLGGGASAFAAGIANILNHPNESIWHVEFWSTVGTTFVIAGMISMFAFMRNKPLPELKTVTNTTAVTEQAGKPPVAVTTVSETHTEPVNTEGKA